MICVLFTAAHLIVDGFCGGLINRRPNMDLRHHVVTIKPKRAEQIWHPIEYMMSNLPRVCYMVTHIL